MFFLEKQEKNKIMYKVILKMENITERKMSRKSISTLDLREKLDGGKELRESDFLSLFPDSRDLVK